MDTFCKPKLDYESQIIHLASKGITFEYISKSDAKSYLMENNNLFKLSSYRKNFNKDVQNERYLNLDFAYLVDLAVIDTRLRMIILEMSLSIEHFAKVKLLRRITLSDEDGYTIVSDYMNSLDDDRTISLKKEIKRNQNSIYCHDLYEKYHNNMPVWAFLEIISFGTFISFYKFCADRFFNKYDNNIEFVLEDKKMISEFFLLLDVKHIRNAAAHNNCILNDLKTKSSETKRKADFGLLRELSKINFSQTTLTRKLSNKRILQIVTCLYALKVFVPSKNSQKYFAWSLHEFSGRLFREYDYNNNLLIHTTFCMFSKIIDKWFPNM